MINKYEINPKILDQIQVCARRQNLSVEELILKWLNQANNPQEHPFQQGSGSVKNTEIKFEAEKIRPTDIQQQKLLDSIDFLKHVTFTVMDIPNDDNVFPAKNIEILYRALFNQANDAVFILNLSGKHMAANLRACEMFGYSPEDIVSLGYSDLVVHSEHEQSAMILQRLLAGEQVGLYERTFRRKDGTLLDIEVNVELVCDENNNPIFIHSILRDITERKQIEKKLKATLQFNERIIDTSLNGMYIYDFSLGSNIFINKQYTQLLGHTIESVNSMTQEEFFSLFHPDDHNKLIAHMQTVANAEDNEAIYIEYRFKNANGEWCWCLSKDVVFERDKNGAVTQMLGSFLDITERKQEENILRVTKEKYQSIVEDSPLLMCLVLPSGKITFANKAYCDSVCKSYEELLLQNFFFLLDEVDQHLLLSTMSSATIESPTFTQEVRVTVYSNETHWQRWTGRALFDAEDNLTVYQFVGEDITERKKAEAVTLEYERLKLNFQVEKEKNTLVRQVVSALSHDLKNSLSIVKTSRDILDRYFDKLSAEKRQNQLDTIQNQIDFATRILDDTVQIALNDLNKHSFDPQLTNLDVLCKVSIDEIATSYGSKHRLQYVNQNGVDTVLIDEMLVNRILLNLLTNAIKFSQDGSLVTLEAKQVENTILLRVIDEGIGIPPDEIPHIFDPFYRTQNAQDIGGTGQGLNIVKNCVERHQGRIRVESQIGKGTAFTIELPLKAG